MKHFKGTPEFWWNTDGEGSITLEILGRTHLQLNGVWLTEITEDQAKEIVGLPNTPDCSPPMELLMYVINAQLKSEGYVLWTEEYVGDRLKELRKGGASKALKPVLPEEILIIT